MIRCLCICFVLLKVTSLASSTSLPSWSAALPPRGGSTSADDGVLPDQRMPSLFSPDQTDYDRYAACLAATESLRRLRDKSMAESKRLSAEDAKDEQKRIHAEYVINSGKVLKAMGMSVSQFNQLGRQVNQDEVLKEKVSYIFFAASQNFKISCASEWLALMNPHLRSHFQPILLLFRIFR